MASDSTHRVINPSVLYVGTPAYLVATQNPDGSTNLAPASSHFALGRTIVLGLEELGQSLDNLRRHGQFTVNFPSASQWAHVERLATVTGRHPVPAEKAGQYTFEPDKFARADLTAISSTSVDVPRVAQAPIQLECRVVRITPSVDGAFGIVEGEVLVVHALDAITVAGTNHLDPEQWHPLIYIYRHFFDRGREVGWTEKTPFSTKPSFVTRWEEGGGTWQISLTGSEGAQVELLQCDGGQVVDVVPLTERRDVLWARRALDLA